MLVTVYKAGRSGAMTDVINRLEKMRKEAITPDSHYDKCLLEAIEQIQILRKEVIASARRERDAHDRLARAERTIDQLSN